MIVQLDARCSAVDTMLEGPKSFSPGHPGHTLVTLVTLLSPWSHPDHPGHPGHTLVTLVTLITPQDVRQGIAAMTSNLPCTFLLPSPWLQVPQQMVRGRTQRLPASE
jgi:hypothetical protein